MLLDSGIIDKTQMSEAGVLDSLAGSLYMGIVKWELRLRGKEKTGAGGSFFEMGRIFSLLFVGQT